TRRHYPVRGTCVPIGSPVVLRSDAGAMTELWGDAPGERHRSRSGRGHATPSERAEFSSMANDYAQYALSQRGAFEATHPAALAAAGLLADAPAPRVAGAGA